MMKKICLVNFMYAIAFIGLFTACDDNDYDGPEPDEVTANYSNKLADGDRANLALTYSGSEMIGKSVYFKTTDARTAEMTLVNVLPHEAQTKIENISLTPDGNNGYSFTGNATGTATATAFKYDGVVTDGKLTVNLSEVKVPGNAISGAWDLVTPATVTTDSTRLVNPSDRYETKWQTYHYAGGGTLKIVDEDMSMDLGGLLGPFLGNFVRTVVRDVSFNTDGNITASYASIPDTLDVMTDLLFGLGITNRAESDWKTSPVNLATYYMTDDTTLYVVPQVDMIIRQIQTNKGLDTRAGETNFIQAIQRLYAMVNRWSTTGIKLIVKKNPQTYVKGGSSFRVTYSRFGGDYTIAIRKDEIEPLFELLKVLPDSIKNISIAELPGMGAVTVGALTDLLAKTTDFELLLYFNKPTK